MKIDTDKLGRIEVKKNNKVPLYLERKADWTYPSSLRQPLHYGNCRRHPRLRARGSEQQPEVLPRQKAVKGQCHLGPGRASKHAQRGHTAVLRVPSFLGIFFHKQRHTLSVGSVSNVIV